MSDHLTADLDLDGALRDLGVVESRLDATLADTIGEAASDVAQDARTNMKAGTVDWSVPPGHEPLPHIRDTYTATAEGLVANVWGGHPGTVAWEFGAELHPNSPQQTIHIPRAQPVGRAAFEHLDRFEADLLAATHRLLTSFHL